MKIYLFFIMSDAQASCLFLPLHKLHCSSLIIIDSTEALIFNILLYILCDVYKPLFNYCNAPGPGILHPQADEFRHFHFNLFYKLDKYINKISLMNTVNLK